MKRASKKLGVKIEKSAEFDAEFTESEKPSEEDNVEDDSKIHKLCVSLDNFCLEAFSLMERFIKQKLEIEKLMTDGELHLAKSRYIMGQRNVSALQLPTTNKENVSAITTITEASQDHEIFTKPRLDLQFMTKKSEENEEKKNSQDPLKWFGLLVPQDLRAAQNKYKSALHLIVDCANIQIRLHEVFIKIKQLKRLKLVLKNSEKK